MLDRLPIGAKILDPMCGSGVVLRQAGHRGHYAVGIDVDPLAVLMSRVWTSRVDHLAVTDVAADVVAMAKRSRLTPIGLTQVGACPETQQFINYWFAEKQQNQLARLSGAIARLAPPSSIRDLLHLALSRTIVTKHVGASLAWDVSHSRPHRMRLENDYNVFSGFESSVRAILARLVEQPNGKICVKRGDCRDLKDLVKEKFDAVVTSPPYLNAIDYLRGHKLALVWLGYTIPELRNIRSGSIGTEKSGSTRHQRTPDYPGLEALVPGISKLPIRQKSIVNKYAHDAEDILKELQKVVVPGGKLVLVLADSVVRGVEVPSSKIFSDIACRFGFKAIGKVVREIPAAKRYLPIAAETSSLARRMRYESVETFTVMD
ncbi:hypothetical protein [Xanthomonas sp. LF06-19]|uniref:hypothetical protein n=1 Tax=Xanthomonas sp. LF06-19 TaxID=3097551 RepID=UPI002A803106|nr:hypothetical protein [Xanthomonas sp. LF06-19]MDY4282682.1 hypothetical protein [Xanthomonas sp. LF06-19]